MKPSKQVELHERIAMIVTINLRFFLALSYEDVLSDQRTFVMEACKCYPLENMKDIAIVGSSSQKKDGKVTWEAGF